MADLQIKMWVEAERPAVATQRAQALRNAILNEAPATVINRERTDPEAQDGGAILVIAISHVAVMGVIEGVRFLWERYREPVLVQLPDGSTIAVRGATDEFINALHSLVGNGIHESSDE